MEVSEPYNVIYKSLVFLSGSEVWGVNGSHLELCEALEFVKECIELDPSCSRSIHEIVMHKVSGLAFVQEIKVIFLHVGSDLGGC